MARNRQFPGVVREDGRWHRHPYRRLVRWNGSWLDVRQVGWIRWLLRWGDGAR